MNRAYAQLSAVLLVAASLVFVASGPSAGRRPPTACSRTLTSGSIERFVNNLAPGQKGCLKGAFREDVEIRQRGVTLRSAPGTRAYVCGQIFVDDSADDVTLRGLRIDGSCSSANTMYLRGERTRIEYNNITNRHKGQSCILVGQDPAGWQADNVKIRHNRIHGCGMDATRDQGIYLLRTTGTVIEDNVIFDISAFAMQFWGDVRNSTFAHNVTDGGPATHRGGLIVGADEGPLPRGNLVADNIISYTAGVAVEGWGGSGNVVRGNCFWQNEDGSFRGSGFSPTNNIVVRSPPFVNRNAHDYRLRRGSRCAGKGPRA
jgi:Right handed beta helix region